MRFRLTSIAALIIASPLAWAQAGDGRIYVQRIEFVGTERIDDEVLRRRMLQVEGTYVNTVALERSRQRLENLPYVERAEIQLRPLSDAPDQVDVVVTITDAPARRWGGGGAWSESQRASVNAFFLNENLLGTGNRFAARVDASEIRTGLDLAHTNPFVGRSDISRSIRLRLRDSERLTVDASDLEADVGALSLEFRYPIKEQQGVSFGLGVQGTDLTTGEIVSDQLFDWISTNGNPGVNGASASTDYLSADLLFGWQYDSRDVRIFPTSGVEHELRLRATLPGSEVEYATLDYQFDGYWPLGRGWIANVGARIGYGTAFGSDTSSLPPNLNGFAGGFRSVRGFRENSLGPKDSLANPYGGNLHTSAQLELIVPLPEEWQSRTRVSLFYDVGSVFSTEDVEFLDGQGAPIDYGFDASELRQSFGIATRIRLPFGIVGLSYGVPIDADDDNPDPFLVDEVERVQLTLGIDF